MKNPSLLIWHFSHKCIEVQQQFHWEKGSFFTTSLSYALFHYSFLRWSYKLRPMDHPSDISNPNNLSHDIKWSICAQLVLFLLAFFNDFLLIYKSHLYYHKNNIVLYSRYQFLFICCSNIFYSNSFLFCFSLFILFYLKFYLIFIWIFFLLAFFFF